MDLVTYAMCMSAGGKKYRCISKVKITEDVTSIKITQDDSGKDFALKRFIVIQMN